MKEIYLNILNNILWEGNASYIPEYYKSYSYRVACWVLLPPSGDTRHRLKTLSAPWSCRLSVADAEIWRNGLAQHIRRVPTYTFPLR